MNVSSTLRIGALIVAVSMPGTAGVAIAQESPYVDFNHPSVTIDLSVLDDGGYGVGETGIALNQNLLVPGKRSPASMLHVPPVGGTAAASARPAAAPRAIVKKAAPAPRQKKVMAKVEPVAAPVVAPAPVAAPAPAPAPAPVAAPAAPAKPKIAAPAPKKLVAPVVAQSAPPPPTVAEAPKVTPTETAKLAPTPAAEPKKQKTEQASLPAASADAELGLAMQVIFANDATRLPAEAKDNLKSLAQRLKSQNNVRLQLMAYAGGDKLSASLARRLSLSRALAVRSFLIENGIRSTRIDVRALGNKTGKEPFNRVDLNITER